MKFKQSVRVAPRHYGYCNIFGTKAGLKTMQTVSETMAIRDIMRQLMQSGLKVHSDVFL